jgi:4'-phosphopantetheinyl transferase
MAAGLLDGPVRREERSQAARRVAASSVDVFMVDGADFPSRHFELLDRAERERHSLAASRGRPGYAAGRVALRLLLGARLGVRPEQVELVRHCGSCGQGGHGKPALANGERHDDLGFSVATASTVSLIAIALHGRVGVDVQPVPAGEPVFWPRPCFGDGERELLGRIASRQRTEATARAWVRKEAVAKCAGKGLGMPLREIEVSGPEVHWRLPDPSIAVGDLELGPPFVGALAYDGQWAQGGRVTVPAVAKWRWR